MKLTTDVQTRICNAIAAGHTKRHAAAVGGVSEQTLYNWIKKGKEAKRKGIYKSFVLELERAEAAFAEKFLQRIRDAAMKPADVRGPEHAKWLLERRFPKDFGRQVVEHDGIPPGAGGAGPVVNFVFDDGESEGLTATPKTATIADPPDKGDQDGEAKQDDGATDA